MEPLTERERRFVEAFMGPAAGNATKAATLAGYSEKTAAQQASRLLRKVKVASAVAARAESAPDVADRAERQRFWTSIQRTDAHAVRDRLRASELQAKSCGEFIEKHEQPPGSVSIHSIINNYVVIAPTAGRAPAR